VPRIPWIVLVVGAFCVPLFIGLGRTDLQNDEAGYSYGVDLILENGDWLNPRSSPEPDTVFLEKPPLKFWMVAAPIRLGLLPHDEFGLRAVDVLLSGIAFIYIFGIGRRLTGPLCGAIAVLVVFAYKPLLFDHGLRGNHMEASLLLAYCGGVYHWLAWATAAHASQRRGHVLAVGLFFYLGFMTKFVAVMFLPLVLGLATLIFAGPRRRMIDEWRHWALAFTLFLLFAAPWFVYQQIARGNALWRTIFGEHVYARLTSSLDVAHLQPWSFYLVEVFTELQRNGTQLLVIGGLILLLVRVVTRRWLEGFVVLAWFLVPVSLMSMMTSKLHHYAYPFLPSLGLAAGYFSTWFLRLIEPGARSAFQRVTSRVLATEKYPIVGRLLVALAVAAVVLSLLTLAIGQVRWELNGVTLLRNTDVVRPLLVAAVLLILAGRSTTTLGVAGFVVVLLVVSGTAYRRTVTALPKYAHPLRTARDCLLEVREGQVRAGRVAPPIYAVAPATWFLHSYFYYLRHPDGWERVEAPEDSALADALSSSPRPVLISRESYGVVQERHKSLVPAPMGLPPGTAVLLLPGPYAVCGDPR
jgi:4-amino-4-deoxy-L-arabinose transferase-like glycosyltransferase